MNSLCLKRFDVSKPGAFVSTYAQMLNAKRLTKISLIATTKRLVQALKMEEHNLFMVSKLKANTVKEWFAKKKIIKCLRAKILTKKINLLNWVERSISFFK